MESLLIVDDEVIIADGLYHMLQEVFQDRLEVSPLLQLRRGVRRDEPQPRGYSADRY